MLQLRAQAKALGEDTSLAEIEQEGEVAARALIADLAAEANDYGDDDNETFAEFGPVVTFADLND